MINPEELAVCKRRGHDAGFTVFSDRWMQCKWCGMGLRQVRTIEEREQEPPKDEQEIPARSN